MVLYSDFEIKEFNAAALGAGYVAFDAIFSNPCYEATIINESNVAVYISVDGTTNNFRVGAGKSVQLSTLPRHNTLTLGEYLFRKGSQLYIKQVTAAGTGIIVLNASMTR